MLAIASKFELLDLIGSGGMATVHRARQRGAGGFERMVAVKQLRPEFSSQSKFVERFIREARVASALAHQNIVQIYDFGQTETGFFIAMEHLEGWTLNRVARCAAQASVSIPLPVVLSLLFQLCDALDHVHTRVGADAAPLAMVHHDVSLANLVVTRTGQLKLIDFGIATSTEAAPTSELVGKPSYMAPEAVRSAASRDAAVDVYAAGVVAWELLACKKLFTGTERAIYRQILTGKIDAPSCHRADCPPMLDAAVLGALAADPHKRPTAARLRDQIAIMMGECWAEAAQPSVARWLARMFVTDNPGVTEIASGFEPAQARGLRDDVIQSPHRPHSGTPMAWPIHARSLSPAVGIRAIHHPWLRPAAVASVLVAVVLGVGAWARRPVTDVPAAGRHPITETTATTVHVEAVEHMTVDDSAPPIIQRQLVRDVIVDEVDDHDVTIDDATVAAVPPPREAKLTRPGMEPRREQATRAVESRRERPNRRSAEPPRVTQTSVLSASTAAVDVAPRVVEVVASTPKPVPPVNAPVPPTLPSKPVGPRTIPPDRVTMIEGEIRVDRQRLEHEGLARIASVLCIDTRGRVSSIRFVGSVPGWIRDAIDRDLRTFRFTPYLEQGSAVPVCFTRTLMPGRRE